MGAIAEGILAYAQPLIEKAGASLEEMNEALDLATACWNLAILPKEARDELLSELQQQFDMDDEEFESLRVSLLHPMIQRHEEMFPFLHRRRVNGGLLRDWPSPTEPEMAVVPRKSAVDRYAPCPCDSGKKYKFCCGRKDR